MGNMLAAAGFMQKLEVTASSSSTVTTAVSTAAVPAAVDS
jgi:hypothetical protein